MLLYTFYVHVKTDLMKKDVAPAMVAPCLIVVYVSIVKTCLNLVAQDARCCVQRNFFKQKSYK